jgi:phage gp36-like protein
MPNQLAIIPHASSTATASGVGAVLDIGDRSYVEIQLDVTAVTSGTSVAVTVETSSTQSNWVLATRIPPVLVTGYTPAIVPDARRYIRVTWTITGTSPSVTFSITGKAHQLYTKPIDVQQYGISANALSNKSLESIARSCFNASSEAEGYLVSGTTTPILTIDQATKQHITAMAVYDLLRFTYGFGDESSGGTRIESDRNEAIAWLKSLSAGRVKPPDLTYTNPTDDSDPSFTSAYSALVVSGRKRGW